MFGSCHWEKRLVKEKKKRLQNFLRLQLKPAFLGKVIFVFFSQSNNDHKMQSLGGSWGLIFKGRVQLSAYTFLMLSYCSYMSSRVEFFCYLTKNLKSFQHLALFSFTFPQSLNLIVLPVLTVHVIPRRHSSDLLKS